MNWIEAGGLDDLPKPGGRKLRTPQGDIALFRTSADEVYALADKCPHRGGPLSQGMVYGQRVQCCMHGLNLDLASGKAVAPDQGCATSYPVKVEGGRVWIGLSLAAAGCACA
ncbi:MAG: nitrite reductase small subunit NirD [Betaproteobacteria bacterium]|nr:nitrite reductase small subunit NirD [Betaproteobacteria bacterium]